MKYILLNFFARIFEIPFRISENFRRAIKRLFYLSYLRSRVNKISTIPSSTQFDGKIAAVKNTNIELGEYCRLGKNVFFETQANGKILLGNNVRINTGCLFVSHANIKIGNDCLIGEYSSVRDADHGIAKNALTRKQPHISKKIIIEDNVWIGRGAAILKGVKIGTGAVVAANSVVTRDVESYTIVAGSPASFIKHIK